MPAALDLTRPNTARVYDYLLGGKDNFAADREQGDILLGICPLPAQRVRQNGAFLARRLPGWQPRASGSS